MRNIKYGVIAFLMLVLLGACEESAQKDREIDDVPTTNETPEGKNNSEENGETEGMEEAPVDYFSVCENLELWKGGIQGVESSDSTGPYIMGQCFANEHFDIIVYTEKNIELSEAIVNHNELNKTIPGARYYAFAIPKVEKENPEDEFDLYDYVYPSEVKVYKLIEGNWYLLNKEEVTTFEELGRLKLNSIYQ